MAQERGDEPARPFGSVSKRVIGLSLALAVGASALILWNLGAPERPFWDEGFYITDARRFFRAGGMLANPEHPPLGKFLIGVCIQIFGDHGVGWRLAPALATILTIALLPLGLSFAGIVDAKAPLWLLALPSLCLLLDPNIFTTSRVATLDALLMSFSVAAAIFYLASLARDSWRLRIAASILSGVALATKWTALTLFPLFLLTPALTIRDPRNVKLDARRVAELFLPAAVTYLAAYALPGAMHFEPSSFTVAEGPLDTSENWLVQVLSLQWKMVSYHTFYFKSPWRSRWYEWLYGRQPIWYSVVVEGDTVGIIAAISAPILWLLGEAAALTCLVVGVKRRLEIPVAIGLLSSLQLALWASALRMTMMNYMNNITPFLALALAWCAGQLLGRGPRIRRGLPAGAAAALALSLAWFVFVHPLLVRAPLEPEAQRRYFQGPWSKLLTHDAMPVESTLEMARAGLFNSAPVQD